jgi:hypothetical protein
MMTGRFFSWNNVTDFFYNRRGSATIWLIAAICFVTVFLGIVFFTLREQNAGPETANGSC